MHTYGGAPYPRFASSDRHRTVFFFTRPDRQMSTTTKDRRDTPRRSTSSGLPLRIREAPEITQDMEAGEGCVLGEPMTTGLFRDVPDHVYHGHPAISRSMVKTFLDCEAHFGYELEQRTPWEHEEEGSPSSAMKMGTAVHAWILEPEVANERYKVSPDQCEATKGSGDRCTYAPKGFYTDEDQGGEFLCGTHSRGREPDDDVIVLTHSEAEQITGMYDSLTEHDEARRLLFDEPGESEVTGVCRAMGGILPLRARFDRLICDLSALRVEKDDEEKKTSWHNDYTIVDLKTVDSAHPKDVQRKHRRTGSWLQPVLYSIVFWELTGVWPDFRFVYVERQPPYPVVVYQWDSVQLHSLFDEVSQVLAQMVECIEDDEYQAYTDDVAVTALSSWDAKRLLGMSE